MVEAIDPVGIIKSAISLVLDILWKIISFPFEYWVRLPESIHYVFFGLLCFITLIFAILLWRLRNAYKSRHY